MEPRRGRHEVGLRIACVLAANLCAPPFQGPVAWRWDGNEEKPTITPSINHVGCWHGWLKEGCCNHAEKIRLFAALVFPWTAYADLGLCYPDVTQVPRDAAGNIKRSTAQRAMFVRDWPCPATHEVTGSCPGWAVDHIIPGGRWLRRPQKYAVVAAGDQIIAHRLAARQMGTQVYARPQQDAPPLQPRAVQARGPLGVPYPSLAPIAPSGPASPARGAFKRGPQAPSRLAK